MVGFLGKCVLLVREGDMWFKEVKLLNVLWVYWVVLGYDWFDLKIFCVNDILVLEMIYWVLFWIVLEGFVDMFLRSVVEIKEEFVDKVFLCGLIIDDYFIILYLSFIFFFVGSDN